MVEKATGGDEVRMRGGRRANDGEWRAALRLGRNEALGGGLVLLARSVEELWVKLGQHLGTLRAEEGRTPLEKEVQMGRWEGGELGHKGEA